MLEGELTLVAVKDSEQGLSYTVEVAAGAQVWATRAKSDLATLDIGVDYTISESLIEQSWVQDDAVVRFLPVVRDRYEVTNSVVGVEPAHKIMSASDYHPFMRVKTLTDKIFEQSGYAVRSQFMESELYRSLYMSAVMPSSDTSSLRRRMGFCAAPEQNRTAVADFYGRVYCSPYRASNTFGNVVTTAVANSEQTDLYNNGGAFGMVEGEICFRPTTKITVGFELELHYITDYKIATRNTLKGFDRVQLGVSPLQTFSLANRFEDMRGNFTPNFEYRAVVFDHVDGTAYRLACTSGGAEQIIKDFSTRSTLLSTSLSNPSSPRLYYRPAGVSSFTEYGGDWALYEGRVAESGRVEVDVMVEFPAREVTPSSPQLFHQLYLGGADEGMAMTLLSTTRLRPIFGSVLAVGRQLKWADLSGYKTSQLKLLSAVCQMFNLQIVSDDVARIVAIEPETISSASPHDWSIYLDHSKPIEIWEAGDDYYRSLTLGYATGDGASDRYATDDGVPFGRYVYNLNSKRAKNVDKLSLNPLFHPSVSVDNVVPDAPSARLILVGNRDADDENNMSFPVKIVRYAGLTPLPNGERWSYPSSGSNYPRAEFHAPDFTLCFEDRDGQAGLHHHYDEQLSRLQNSRRLSAYFALPTHIVASLLNPDALAGDLPKTVCVTLYGERVECILERIENYDLARCGSVKCVLVQR